RKLEAAGRANPTSAANRFVLAYHYMVQEHLEMAQRQFEEAARLQPKDELAAQFAKLLSANSEASTIAEARPGQTTDADLAPEPAPPPAELVGRWSAKPAPDLSIELTIQDNGQFAWVVNSRGQTDSITGEAEYRDGVLALNQTDAPPLAGK